VAFIITYISIPSLIEVARAKNLYDVPNGRTSHEVITPTLGGMAIFSGFIISTMIFGNISKMPYMQYVVAAMIVVFFLGLKDDIIGLSPMKKFIGQIIAAGIIIDMGNIRLDDLHGFAGIYDLNYYSSDLLTLLVIIGIVNAFNLIDGIDGLSSGIGIIASATFGTWFYLVGHYQLTILSFALTGALLAFFRFNVFSLKNKIFMGDIGSLILGFIMAILAIKFNEINTGLVSPYALRAAPAVSIGILIVPIYDTLRVFAIRMYRGGSPFAPDRGHVHHRLLDLTRSHKKATAILLSIELLFIIISFLLSDLRIWQLTLVLFILATTLSYIPVYLVNKKKKAPTTNP
jgi:UDP-N-acetylmuramyl pentapeptide phosphotransferase/UDP-N-acetylglucosamine-1-phosphate transferase